MRFFFVALQLAPHPKRLRAPFVHARVREPIVRLNGVASNGGALTGTDSDEVTAAMPAHNGSGRGLVFGLIRAVRNAHRNASVQ